VSSPPIPRIEATGAAVLQSCVASKLSFGERLEGAVVSGGVGLPDSENRGHVGCGSTVLRSLKT
jgi:hypothetical protein